MIGFDKAIVGSAAGQCRKLEKNISFGTPYACSKVSP